MIVLRLRTKQDPYWPRRREGARKDEKAWIAGLSDRELAEHAAALYQVDKAVKGFRKPRKDAA